MDFMGISLKRRGRRWADLPDGTRRGIALATSLQMALLASAVIDLVRRPSERVRGGRKWPWIPVLLVNFIGPIVYLLFGRRSVPHAE